MKYLVWIAAFVLLLDFAISLDATPPQPCREDKDCMIEQPPGKAKCEDLYCKCLTNEGKEAKCATTVNVIKEESQKIGQAGLVGHPCTGDHDCSNLTANAICNMTNRQCACSDGFFVAGNNTKCLARVHIGQPGCVESVQCGNSTSNTTCFNGVCKCQDNYYLASNACWANTPFGKTCATTDECSHVANAVCDNNQHVCSCPSDKVINPDETSCLPKASKINDQCEESIQCDHLGGACLDKRCQCRTHHHLSQAGDKCQKTKSVNETCENDHECSQSHHQDGKLNLKCIKKICSCESNLKYDKEKGTCVESNSAANLLSNVGVFAMSLVYFGLVAAWL